MDNAVQLIAYADRLGGTIAGTADVIAEHFPDAIGGIHFLPFFVPYDGADAGFDPEDHTRVDPRLGTWDDVRDLSRRYGVMVDVIVNHVSSRSEQFRDVIARGDESPHADLFLTFSSVFPDGATESELTAIYRPRPGLPFSPVVLGGRKRLAWTTFTPQQIDIDVESPSGREYLETVLDTLADAGVSMVRIDAAGYAVKRAGRSCFMMPETFAFIAELAATARARGLEVLVEIHSYYRQQIEIASRVDRVYDFALPPLILHAFHARDLEPLGRWLEIRPVNCVTVLDTHDGIGVIDVGASDGPEGGPGLLEPAQIDALVESIHAASRGESRLATGASASNLDLYQVNSTFHAALGYDDRRSLAARCIQLFVPGVPQVYYVGALLGGNDLDLLAQTSNGRDINRHRYAADEVTSVVERPAVAAQLQLMAFRNAHPAFDGTFAFDATADELTLSWVHGDHRAQAAVNIVDSSVRLLWTTPEGEQVSDDLIAEPPHGPWA